MTQTLHHLELEFLAKNRYNQQTFQLNVNDTEMCLAVIQTPAVGGPVTTQLSHSVRSRIWVRSGGVNDDKFASD